MEFSIQEELHSYKFLILNVLKCYSWSLLLKYAKELFPSSALILVFLVSLELALF